MTFVNKWRNVSTDHYTNPNLIHNITNLLKGLITEPFRQVIVVCIGTDRSTGDSLGPQTGTFLTKNKPRQLLVFGTLHQPIHALNLEETILQINQFFHNPFIIAVDAALGQVKSIGNITCSPGPLLPGAAFNKNLPLIGDISLTGVVNCKSTLDYAILQTTRLALVYDMANNLSIILNNLDIHLENLQFQHVLKDKVN